MPDKVEITRSPTIVVDKVGEETTPYGKNFTWTDKEGNSYRVKIERKQYFDKITPGAAVQVNYVMNQYGKEMIWSVESVKDKLPGEVRVDSEMAKLSAEQRAKGDPPAKEISKVEHKSSPETGMWWKELGDMLRCGDIDKNTLGGKSLRNAYYKEMLRVLEVNLKGVKPSKLVEAAEKLGAEIVDWDKEWLS